MEVNKRMSAAQRKRSMKMEYNKVDIVISYKTDHAAELRKVYSAGYNETTGVQQYLDYYQQGFLHDHPEAIEMEIVLIEAYHNDRPRKRHSIYVSKGGHKWSKEKV